jgi:2-polyprenyl-3-methyl-5-hydroxy-6-metoxy-1,4-benzoquinol methylase
VNGRLAFVISNNHCMMPDQFFWSYQQMMKPGDSFAVKGFASTKKGSINEGIYKALNLGAEWVFLMDVDQVFPPITIPRLFETAKKHDAKVVSVEYHIGRPPYAPVAGWVRETKEGDFAFVNSQGKEWKNNYSPLGDGVVEVDWVGSGGVLIHRDVLDAIGTPWFEDVWNQETGARECGHDVYFSMRARAKGYKILVDTAIDSGHGKFVYIGRKWSEAFHKSGMAEEMENLVHLQSLESNYWDVVWQTESIKKFSRDKTYAETHEAIVGIVPEGAHVADVGSGPGVLLDILREKKKCVGAGYDFSEQAVNILKKNGHQGFVADVRSYAPNGDAGSYDVVVSTHAIEHMQDDAQYVDLLKKLTKPGGKVVVATPWREEVQGHFEHVRGYTEESLREVLSKQFKDVTVTKNNRDYIATGVNA